MRRFRFFVFSFLILAFLSGVARGSTPDLLDHNPFGTLYVYPPDSGTTNTVVIIISGDGGWRGSVLNMATLLSSQNTLVVGFDIRHYFHQIAQRGGSCTETVSDFVGLSRFVGDKYEVDGDRKALLIGYSSGATLVYGVLVQAPSDSFLGGISFGFCPDLQQLHKPLCRVDSVPLPARKFGLSFLPAKNLETRWYAFQGTTDEVCNEQETADYVSKVPNSKFVLLPDVGHGFKKPKGWIAEFRDAYRDLTHQELSESLVGFQKNSNPQRR